MKKRVLLCNEFHYLMSGFHIASTVVNLYRHIWNILGSKNSKLSILQPLPCNHFQEYNTQYSCLRKQIISGQLLKVQDIIDMMENWGVILNIFKIPKKLVYTYLNKSFDFYSLKGILIPMGTSSRQLYLGIYLEGKNICWLSLCN